MKVTSAGFGGAVVLGSVFLGVELGCSTQAVSAADAGVTGGDSATRLTDGATDGGASDAGPSALNVFYAVHVQLNKTEEYAPYTDATLKTLDRTKADEFDKPLRKILEKLNEHKLRGSFQFPGAAAIGLCEMDPTGNAILALLAGKHAFGLHMNKTSEVASLVAGIKSKCGVSPTVLSGLNIEVSAAAKGTEAAVAAKAMATGEAAGMHVVMQNLTPSADPSLTPLTCTLYGVSDNNEAHWSKTGNLLFPWRPDVLGNDPCKNLPSGTMVLMDPAHATWMNGPKGTTVDVLTSANFDVLRPQLAAALGIVATERPARPTSWSFVSHLHEYVKGGEVTPTPAAMDALDVFLSEIVAKIGAGEIVNRTPEEIAPLVP